MPFRTDDPLADFSRWERQKEQQTAKRPLCSYCDEPITDDVAYYIEGEWICEYCMENHFRKPVPEE